MKTIKEKIIHISEIVPEISYFEFEGFDEDEHEAYESLTFITRENGDVGAEEFSPIDIREARRVQARIQEIYPEVKSKVYTCDEWVYIDFNF